MADNNRLTPLREMVGKEFGRIYAWDKVNPAMVRQWCEVMGVENPLYTDHEYALNTEFEGIVAPPAMLQSWCESGLYQNNYPPGSTDENPYGILSLLEEEGYPSVVAVNSELSFDRYIKMGEKLYYTTRFEDLSEEKQTALGTGYFVTLKMTYFSELPQGDEKVGELLFRVFKFKPAQPVEPKKESDSAIPVIKRTKPGISDDNRFFWEGCDAHELRVQHCKTCNKLQHPPAPVCTHCQSFDLDYQVASGKGELYSYVVMHYPEVPPFDHPNPIGLIQLEEGVRITAGLVGMNPKNIEIGTPVEVCFETFDGELTLPLFKVREA